MCCTRLTSVVLPPNPVCAVHSLGTQLLLLRYIIAGWWKVGGGVKVLQPGHPGSCVVFPAATVTDRKLAPTCRTCEPGSSGRIHLVCLPGGECLTLALRAHGAPSACPAGHPSDALVALCERLEDAGALDHEPLNNWRIGTCMGCRGQAGSKIHFKPLNISEPCEFGDG